MELESLAEQVGRVLLEKGVYLVTAESCTGGWVAQAVTSIAGSSQWFDRGFVTYSNRAKQEMLGVRAETLAEHGAVSEETVVEMAAGALRHSGGEVSLAISGIAGPDGGSADKPVGTVWLAWARTDGTVDSRCFRFEGGREAVRHQAVEQALLGVLERLRGG